MGMKVTATSWPVALARWVFSVAVCVGIVVIAGTWLWVQISDDPAQFAASAGDAVGRAAGYVKVFLEHAKAAVS